jgi:hypothetical protein
VSSLPPIGGRRRQVDGLFTANKRKIHAYIASFHVIVRYH